MLLRMLQCEDYKTAYEACRQLMQVRYSAAWVECKALAEAVDFSDVTAKQVFHISQYFIINLNYICCSMFSEPYQQSMESCYMS